MWCNYSYFAIICKRTYAGSGQIQINEFFGRLEQPPFERYLPRYVMDYWAQQHYGADQVAEPNMDDIIAASD